MSEIDIRIRPAVAGDQKLIRKIIRQARLNPIGIHWPAFVIAEGSGGNFLGCAQIKIHKDGSRELASLYVKPEHRGQGIAGDLIRHLRAQARWDLWLTCRSGLVPFYEPWGFIEIRDAGKMPTYFRRVWHLFRIFTNSSAHQEGLAVMLWQGWDDKE